MKFFRFLWEAMRASPDTETPEEKAKKKAKSAILDNPDDRSTVQDIVMTPEEKAKKKAKSAILDNPDDRSTVQDIVMKFPLMLRYASERLKDDAALVKSAASKFARQGQNRYDNTSPFFYASRRLRCDAEFVREMIKISYYNYEFVPDELRESAEFFLQLFNIMVLHHDNVKVIQNMQVRGEEPSSIENIACQWHIISWIGEELEDELANALKVLEEAWDQDPSTNSWFWDAVYHHDAKPTGDQLHEILDAHCRRLRAIPSTINELFQALPAVVMEIVHEYSDLARLTNEQIAANRACKERLPLLLAFADLFGMESLISLSEYYFTAELDLQPTAGVMLRNGSPFTGLNLQRNLNDKPVTVSASLYVNGRQVQTSTRDQRNEIPFMGFSFTDGIMHAALVKGDSNDVDGQNSWLDPVTRKKFCGISYSPSTSRGGKYLRAAEFQNGKITKQVLFKGGEWYKFAYGGHICCYEYEPFFIEDEERTSAICGFISPRDGCSVKLPRTIVYSC